MRQSSFRSGSTQPMRSTTQTWAHREAGSRLPAVRLLGGLTPTALGTSKSTALRTELAPCSSRRIWSSNRKRANKSAASVVDLFARPHRPKRSDQHMEDPPSTRCSSSYHLRSEKYPVVKQNNAG